MSGVFLVDDEEDFMDEDPEIEFSDDQERSGGGETGSLRIESQRGGERFSREPYFLTRQIPGFIRRFAIILIVLGILLLLSPAPEVAVIIVFFGALFYLKAVVLQWQMDRWMPLMTARNRDRNKERP